MPPVEPETPHVYRALHQAMQTGLVRACHDLSEGGLAVTAAEMCIGGRVGMQLEVESADEIFSEHNGQLLVEIHPDNSTNFEALFQPFPHTLIRIGQVTAKPQLEIRVASDILISLSVEQLVSAWNPISAMAS